MRAGETGITSASLDKTKTIKAKQLKRIRAVKILISGRGQVEKFVYDDSYNRISAGFVELAPEVSGRWRIMCERDKTFTMRMSSGTLIGGKAITRRIPLGGADRCEVNVTASAVGEAMWPDEDRMTIVQALVTTVPIKKTKRKR